MNAQQLGFPAGCMVNELANTGASGSILGWGRSPGERNGNPLSYFCLELSMDRRDSWWSWNANTLATWCEEMTHWKRPWCWERLKVWREVDDRGGDDWMASWTRWKWVWARFRSWWWTGKPGVLQSMGSQSQTQLSDWTELSWTDATSLHKFEIRGDSALSLFKFQANTVATILDIT